MAMTDDALSGKRIGVFGKGGSGKSTVVVLLARALRRQSYNVCVLDSDSTNVGLHQALGIEDPPQSLIDHFGGMVFSGGAVTCPVDDPTVIAEAEISLSDLPSAYVRVTEDGIVLLSAGKIGDQGPGAGCDGPIAKTARDLRVHLDDKEPVTLIDFKAGFEDSARGAITSLDWALAVVDPTTAAVRMAIHLTRMVEAIHSGEPPSTHHLENPEMVRLAEQLFRDATIRGVPVVLNKIVSANMEEYLRHALHEADIEPIGVVHDETELGMAWLRGAPLSSDRAERDMEAVVKALEKLQAREEVPA